MNCFNQVILTGNLTRDPEIRTLPSGRPICRLSLAVNESYKTDGGERKERATFVDIDFWDKAAETIAKFCTKGKPLLITGRLRLDQWEDKTSGEKRQKLGVTGDTFKFLPDGRAGDHARSPVHNDPPGGAPAPSAAPEDGDVPF